MVQGIDHAAHPALRTVWIFVGVTFLFVPLRIYIRKKLLGGFKADDYYYLVSFVCLCIYAILVTLSATHGLGRDISTKLSPDDMTLAILDEMIGQTFLIIGNVTSKLSIAHFLNHLAKQLVTKRRYKVFLWAPVVLFAIFVTIALFVSWLSCQPAAHLWDSRVDGHCRKDLMPLTYLAGALSAAVDICYAIYPWYLLWRKYRHPHKLVILLSLSLGLAAAGIGIKRAVELYRLGSPNFLKDTVELVIWHTAELDSLNRLVSRSSWLSRIYGDRGKSRDVEGGVYGMHTIGGTARFYRIDSKHSNGDTGRKGCDGHERSENDMIDGVIMQQEGTINKLSRNGTDNRTHTTSGGPASSPSSTSLDNGLTQGTKAGIGVGATVSILPFLAFIDWRFWHLKMESLIPRRPYRVETFT
ncbi:hypothetical protein CHU98_g12220 [Xylaria longipes]|nr:hypothetical protein CHU98_g12220 [Xylaria longipes]